MCLKKNTDERYNINQVLYSKFLIGLHDESRREECKRAWQQDVRNYINQA